VQFLQIIARAALLKGVSMSVQSVKAIWNRIGHRAYRILSHALEIIAEQKVIVEALASRKFKDATAAMTTHLFSVDYAIASLQSVCANYFFEE
jgi:DNA-binding GntR family transcriptional regulator